MKKLIFIMVAVMAIMFVSCGNDTKDTSNVSSVVVTDSTMVVEEQSVEEASVSEASKSDVSKPEAVEETTPSKPEEVSK